MTKLKVLSVLLCISIFFISCDYEYVAPPDNTYSLNFGNSVSKDFFGQVIDENNNPVQNATITIGTSTVQTDINGVFIINGAEVFEKFAYIKAKKSGYIDGSRAIVPTEEGTNNITIMMLSGAISGTVPSGASSSINLTSGAKVIFDGNFKTESGTAYNGTVNVIMHHLDPSDSNVYNKMPGMLFAENTLGEAKTLETYGMINIELRGSAGQKLQITHTAQIEMPITLSQQGSAYDAIPLWHFDETLGYWKEEGSASKIGNKYVGTVSHFSWWNFDVPFPTVNLSVTVVDTDGNPISNVGVGIFKNGSNNPAISFTNKNGQVSGLVPANESLTLKVYDGCYNVLRTTNIQAFTVNTKLPNIVLNSGAIQSSIVKGTLLKCDDANISNGYVMLRNNGRNAVSAVSNGSFSFSTLFCGANGNFTLEGFDYDNNQTTGMINYINTQPDTNVGNLKACTTIEEFISFKIDNNPVNYITDNINTNAGPGNIGFEINNTYTIGETYISIIGTTIVPGIYTTPQFTMNVSGNVISSQYANTIALNLNFYGNSGQYIDMTFNGIYLDPATGINHSINGVLHVKRD